ALGDGVAAVLGVTQIAATDAVGDRGVAAGVHERRTTNDRAGRSQDARCVDHSVSRQGHALHVHAALDVLDLDLAVGVTQVPGQGLGETDRAVVAVEADDVTLQVAGVPLRAL